MIFIIEFIAYYWIIYQVSINILHKTSFRAKLWLEKCNREINTSVENLYKNYKVCGDHFKSSMFLNNLKNRLQPHAIPEHTKHDNESLELSSRYNAFDLNDKSEENISGRQFELVENIIKSWWI